MQQDPPGEAPEPDRRRGWAVWMDQGGTFTDVVRVDPRGRVEVSKVLSDAADLGALAERAAAVRRGTTVATNALLEDQGEPVLLVTTAGLGDLPWLGDQTRPQLFSLSASRRAPPCVGVVEAAGRIRADGSVAAPAAVSRDALRDWRGRGIRAVAIALAHGPLAPEEELRIARVCREEGFTQITVGHGVAPSRGLLARIRTALVDASTSPLLPRAPGHYLRSDGGLARVGLPGAHPDEWRGAHALLSGPAGGVVAVAGLARRLGLGPAFGLDMGGTSTDVCRVDGDVDLDRFLDIAGLRLRVPSVRLDTIAAGGGSCLGRVAGVLSVGPRSAGSAPGPACYGRGGPATVTDCEAVLGRLVGFPALCGPDRDGPLDTGAARRALAALDPDRPVEVVASDHVAVAQERMAAAVRRIAARQGVELAAHALVAFGGAGPAHACGVAERLGLSRVVVPLLASTWSAVGIGRARRRAEVVVPVRVDPRAAVRAARARLPFPGRVELDLLCRLEGTDTVLPVPLGSASAPPGARLSGPLRQDFDARFQQRFGFRRPELPAEVVEVRLTVVEDAPDRPLSLAPLPAPPTATVRAWFDGWRVVPWRAADAADGLEGPALLSAPGTVVVVKPGWRVTRVAEAVRLDRVGGPLPERDPSDGAVALTLFSSRVTAIAEQMGERLQRLARSVNIRERRDFSCAVFDADGMLVVNAPHVPVHLGAMGETVRTLLARQGAALGPGQCWVSNDPYAGGSHLPDITVVAPLFVGGTRAGFVACRGHHVDVGGSSPGSMPPFSAHIDEEGLLLDLQLLSDGERFRPPPLPGCRQPEVVLADLQAQVAACAFGVARLGDLASLLPAGALQRGFAALLDRAEEAVRRALRARPGRYQRTERFDDGHVLDVELEIGDGRGEVWLRSAAHPGNRNAPRAVARAALLYVLRCLIDEPLPLNEGALRPLRIHATPGGLFSPAPPAAVVGGNVETSQLLVDALLVALGASAASQGTMNNLTIGTPTGSWYETIAGGGGAGPGFAGLAASQVHMTNTRGTDVEELEHRFGVVVELWRRRAGSGGGGIHPGGDGVLKQWRFTVPADVALLAGRRRVAAVGVEGGGPGALGRDLREQEGVWGPAPARWQARPGDRLRIETPGGGGWGRGGSPPDGVSGVLSKPDDGGPPTE